MVSIPPWNVQCLLNTQIRRAVGELGDVGNGYIFSMPTMPGEDGARLKNEIFHFKHLLCSESYRTIGYAPWGLPHALMLIGGAFHVVGVNAADVPGQTMQTKVDYVENQPLANIKDLIDKNGFQFTHGTKGLNKGGLTCNTQFCVFLLPFSCLHLCHCVALFCLLLSHFLVLSWCLGPSISYMSTHLYLSTIGSIALLPVGYLTIIYFIAETEVVS